MARVSIPYRYGTTQKQGVNMRRSPVCQFLIGMVRRLPVEEYLLTENCVNSL